MTGLLRVLWRQRRDCAGVLGLDRDYVKATAAFRAGSGRGDPRGLRRGVEAGCGPPRPSVRGRRRGVGAPQTRATSGEADDPVAGVGTSA